MDRKFPDGTVEEDMYKAIREYAATCYSGLWMDSANFRYLVDVFAQHMASAMIHGFATKAQREYEDEERSLREMMASHPKMVFSEEELRKLKEGF